MSAYRKRQQQEQRDAFIARACLVSLAIAFSAFIAVAVAASFYFGE
jgi:hypothetical protein